MFARPGLPKRYSGRGPMQQPRGITTLASRVPRPHREGTVVADLSLDKAMLQDVLSKKL
jgi:hypothetical protein